jgi:hypothetical protein
VAALLELAHAAGAAQVVGLDLVLAVRAELVVELHEPRLGRLHLELAQPHVVEVLRRADDRVDDRPDEREQRRERGADVQKTSAAQTTMRTRIRTLTAVLSASLSMPKTPKVSMG